MQAQGGSVGVRSEPGRGSVFHIVLGRRPGAPPLTTDAAAAAHLLAVESAPEGRAPLAQALREAGYRVDVVSHSDEAVMRAHRTPYGAIVLDLLLTDAAGLGVLEGIRRDGATRRAPVVAVSMAAGPLHAARFAIADVLGKPIRGAEVAEALGRLPAPVGRRLRVMVVDDDPTALDLMRATLARLDAEVACVAGGREALAALDTVRPDAIVLDLMMPGFDGFEVLDALHRLPGWRDTPVFVWTAMILSDDEYERLAVSARAILGKGGGALTALLDALRRWRPPMAVLPDREAS